jgi:hypothetical protein
VYLATHSEVRPIDRFRTFQIIENVNIDGLKYTFQADWGSVIQITCS